MKDKETIWKKEKRKTAGVPRKGFGKDGMMLLMEVVILIIFVSAISYWLSRENPQKPSCGICKDVSCPQGFAYAGDCTFDGSACGQCKSSIKTCDGNTAEEWATAGTCTTSKHIAQCVKRADCANLGKVCKDGECS